MQYSYYGLFKKFLKGYHLGIILKSFVLLIVVYYIFIKLQNEEQLLMKIYDQVYILIANKSLVYILVPILLVPVNWSIEAKKWQILASKISPLTFKQALSGVLSGLSLGFITPQSVGDFAGRIWHINNNRRSELIGSVLLGSITQALVSVLVGLFGAFYFIKANNLSIDLSAASVFSISSIGFVYLVKGRLANNFISKFLYFWGQKFLGIISSYNSKELVLILVLSFFRYTIFFLQFVWVLILFGIDLPFDVLCAGVSWIYAAKTIIPAFNFLSDIGVREFSALLFFNSYQVEVTKIILASLFIWIINILIPTVVGSFLMLRMRIF